jgi:hypothetical protein
MVSDLTRKLERFGMSAEFIRHAEFLEAKVSGEYSPAGYLALVELLFAESKAGDISKIFVNLIDVTGQYSELGRFQVGQKVAELFKPPCRIAALDRKERINKFTEDVAINRGAFVFVTHDSKSALDWLL